MLLEIRPKELFVNSLGPNRQWPLIQISVSRWMWRAHNWLRLEHTANISAADMCVCPVCVYVYICICIYICVNLMLTTDGSYEKWTISLNIALRSSKDDQWHFSKLNDWQNCGFRGLFWIRPAGSICPCKQRPEIWRISGMQPVWIFIMEMF
jgi:hypothetical protein